MRNKRFEELVKGLQERGNDRKEPSLKNTEEVLNRFGRPDQDYKVILVGGTNGKGSTVEMVSELLQSRDFEVGTFKSPHLVSARERVKVNGEKISKEEFLELHEEIPSFEFGLTFFEFMTVLAYLYFSERDVDYAIMEVGMGGRLDATNAAEIDTAIITNIGKDHISYLGDTIDQIAGEIAGIIPEEGYVITDSDNKTLEKEARERSAKILRPEEVKEHGGALVFDEERFKIPLKGGFQVENLENALKTVKKLTGLPENLTKALSDLKNEGRMEEISEEPEIIFDGAHNVPALKQTIKEYPEDFICVFAAVKTKDVGEMIEVLEKKASKFYLTDAGVDWAEKPEKIAENVSKPYEIFIDPSEAFEKAKLGLEEDQALIATGSLYMIGHLKSSRRS